MVSERTALLPGKTALIGITVDIDPGWHVYWDGANDSGQPLSVTPSLPAGYTAGELRWPAPKRHVAAGDILDHIYEGRVTLVLPVTVPADAAPGGAAALGAKVEWFVCKDVCMMGESQVQLSLPVAAPGAAEPETSKDAPLLRGPFPEPALPAWIKPSWSGSTLTLTPSGPEAQGAYRLIFCPSRQSVPLADAIRQAAVSGTPMQLDIKPTDAPEARVRGVLELSGGGGGSSKPSRCFTVDLPVPKAP